MPTITRAAVLHVHVLKGTCGDAVPCSVQWGLSNKAGAVRVVMSDAAYAAATAGYTANVVTAVRAFERAIASGAGTVAPYRDAAITAFLDLPNF